MNATVNVFNLVPPKVLKAYGIKGNHLNINDIYRDKYVEVQTDYIDMLKGHAVRARWVTRNHVYNSEILTVETPGPLTFKIPHLEVIDAIGGIATVNYSVRPTPNEPLLISKSLTLNVDQQMFDLSEPRLSADRKNVPVKFLNMTPGYTVRVRWHGVVIRDTETQPIQDTSSMAFDIPASWITENAGKTVPINYSVHRSGSNDNLMFSRLLRITL
jgi:hypothetical protein